MSDEYGRRGNMVRTRIVKSDGGDSGEEHWWFLCPGCEEAHAYTVPRWTRTGTDDAPTFSPSLLCTGAKRCHLFLRDGVLEFLGDCEHPLAGQKVPLPEPPEWLT